MSKTANRILVSLLVLPLVASIPVAALSQSQNSVGGAANGASVNVTATVLGIPASVSVPTVAPVGLPPQGGSFSNQLASASAEINPGVMPVLSTGLIENTTAGSISQTGAHAESSSTVDDLNLINGLITAATIKSKSTSDGNGAGAGSSAAGSFANQLRISGVLYEQSEFAPNTTVNVSGTIIATVGGLQVLVPVSGTVIINEQTSGGDGRTTSSLTVNFLHVSVSGSVAGTISLNANIVVASASSSVNFTGGTARGNNPPTLNLPGPQTVQVGATLSFTASATDPDAGDTVTLAASNIPPGASVTPNPASGNPASSQFTFTPSENQAGQTFTVNFTATDNHGDSTAGSVAVTVTGAQNRPPIISVPGPQVIAVGKTLSFTVTATDPDGDAVTLSASSVPPNAAFDPATGHFVFTPSSDQAGQTLVVTFTATDSKGASASATVQITVVNSTGGEIGAPIISVPPSPIIINVGQTLVFSVTGTSPSPSCAVTLSSSGIPSNASFSPTNGRFSFTPTSDQKDKSFVVTFIATDCIGQNATGTVTIIVVGGASGGIGAPGRVCLPVTKIFFGATQANTNCGFITVSLTNEGAGDLTINSLKLDDGTHFRVEGATGMPLVLKSAAVLQLKIVFQPKIAGTVLDVLTILTSDPDQPVATIVLKGKGR